MSRSENPMNRVFCFCLFWGLIVFQGQSQNLIWEKKIPLSSYEKLSDVIKLSDGTYLGCGYSDRWKIFNPSVGGAILLKFNENGDTISTKWTGFFGGFSGIERVSDDLNCALFGYWDLAASKGKSALMLLNGFGQMIGTIPINTSEGEILLDFKVKDGFIWIAGEKNPSIFYPGGLTFDFMLKKLRMDGTEVFSLVYNGNDQTSRGEKMEFMPNGNILFSGTAGTKLCAFEIDTAGNQIQYRSYFTNPINGGWQNACVLQAPGEKRLIFGNRSTTTTSHYLGIHDTAGTQIWGGFTSGGSTEPMIFDDGSIVHIINSASPSVSKIRKLSSQGSLKWTINLMAPGLIPGRKAIIDTWFESDSSGVCVGAMDPTNGITNLYICKFGGLGIPFNPTSAKAMESLQTNAEPIPFPNPGSGDVKFTILAGPGQVSFTDMQGRTVWKGEYLPEKGISTQTFPSGLYQYRLQRNGKVWTGKWEKN